MTRRLVLLGGGHAHLAVLEDLARQPLPGWEVLLVTPHRRQIYSGMLPGWIAGHYTIDECAIALDTLARRAGAALHLNACVGLDPAARIVHCADGSRIGFELLSIDTGPAPALDGLPGALENALPVRPIEAFVDAWPRLVQRIAQPAARFELVVLGAGAGGVELAMAIRQLGMARGWSHLRVSLVGAAPHPVAGQSGAARRRVSKALQRRGIRWLGERQAIGIDAGQIRFAAHPPMSFEGCVVATGAAAPRWPRASGLATDEAGFIRVTDTLQALQHPHVLAGGDVAAYADARPKSGVFAVRAGPVLARNLRALALGQSPAAWTPQRHALYLLSTGDRHAIAAWGPWAWRGGWVWRWKDAIDRRFVARFGADLAPAQRNDTHPQ